MCNNRKGGIYSIPFILLVAFSCSLNSPAQYFSAKLQELLFEKKHAAWADVKYPNEVTAFYAGQNYSSAWIQNENALTREVLLKTLATAEDFGLVEKDYQFKFINVYKNNKFQMQDMGDSLEADIRLTDAAIHFYSDLAYGNTKPDLGYNGLKYVPDCGNIPALLSEYVSKNILKNFPPLFSNSLPEIEPMLLKLAWLNNIVKQPDFSEVLITSSKVNSSNTALIKKLYQLGMLDSAYTQLADSVLKKKIKEAQRMFNLLADGALRVTVLNELNVPLVYRIRQLNLSINYYRWLNCLSKNQSVIVVNLPAAYLKVYRDHYVITEMRMVVGKKSTPTPTLSSTLDEVVLYPYWHVPVSIATKEILPILKRNPGYINSGNYQVLNSAGAIVDPYAVNWNALSTAYFPYLIRQSTGCDNALGLLKLNFYNPYSVYLHDTNSKNLFGLNKRFFSHGCMRLQKPMELGHLALSRNSIAIDTLEQKGCLRNKTPITVHADEHMPIIVWYNPAGVDSKGQLLFFEDVYGKFNWSK